ncbi:MAG: MFS transporter [Pseudomonadota bacterium]
MSHVARWQSPTLVIVAACLIATIGFGVRSSFGLFLDPITEAKGWSRETFALAMAIQNLLWGFGVPVAGAFADRFGPSRVICLGAVLYAIGITGLVFAESHAALYFSAGILTGLGVAFSAFSLAMAAMARVVGPERRSFVLGLGTAAGSFGQVVFSPLAQVFITQWGWDDALFAMVFFTALLMPLAMLLPSGVTKAAQAAAEQSLREALVEARAHRGYLLLTCGFFVCGFHVAFITVHFPAYVADLGHPGQVGAWCLALIGLFNILGSFGAGWLGQRYSMKVSLSWIYLLRAITIAGLLAAPKTTTTLYAFSAVMGVLWLSTVPLTTGIVARVFGVQYLATLFGIVFLSHQIGSFVGIWWGGWLADNSGSYDGMWYAGIVLGLLAAVVHWFIDEEPLPRLATA